ncbi:MAG: hypothetical protein ACYTG5_20775 [Planctomycetota bacterium]
MGEARWAVLGIVIVIACIWIAAVVVGLRKRGSLRFSGRPHWASVLAFLGCGIMVGCIVFGIYAHAESLRRVAILPELSRLVGSWVVYEFGTAVAVGVLAVVLILGLAAWLNRSRSRGQGQREGLKE